MSKLVVLVTVCLVGNVVMSLTPVLDKPYYDVENAEDLYHDFVKEHEKSYNRMEYNERLGIFKESLKNINRLNAESPGTVFAVNHFADLRPEELEQYHGFKPSNKKGVKAIRDNSVVLPDSFDWRDHNVVTHVKDQWRCGSSYIFSAIGNIEGQYAIKHKECLVLSEQQVLDCLDCGRCDAGIIDEVMHEFANRTVGPMLEKDYPYISEMDTCYEDAEKVVAHVTGGQFIDIPDEDTLMQKLVELGPLSVSIVATDTFGYYRGGIYEKTADCADQNVNHGMLLVGYGEESGKKYWIIKNSWGERWGEKGYIRLIRGVNACQMGTGYTASATVA